VRPDDCTPKETSERLRGSDLLMVETDEALKGVDLQVKAGQEVRRMVEALIEDFGYEALDRAIKKPLESIKIARYVGCQTQTA